MALKPMTQSEREQLSVLAVFFDEREMKVVEEYMTRADVSARASVRHFLRLGQLVDNFQNRGFQLRFLEPDSDSVVDPFYVEPKAAPMPPSEVSKVRSCNRHSDCDAAAADYFKRYPNEKYIPASFHCHSEDCDECFGN